MDCLGFSLYMPCPVSCVTGYMCHDEAYCTLPSCSMKAELLMTWSGEVTVLYKGSISHNYRDCKSRFVWKKDRRTLYELFANGKKPMKEHSDRMAEKEGHTLLCGNFDGIGRTRSVLQKIASESRQQKCEDKDLFQSLAKMKENMKTQGGSERQPGFIQKIGYSPFCVFYYNETGIRLWHDLCNKKEAS